MTGSVFDIAIIGGGPAGYVGAIRAAQLGMKTACIEESPSLGGTCLNVGCIPSKALLESSHHYLAAQKTLKNHGVVLNDVGLDLDAMMRRKERIVERLTGEISYLFEKHGIAHYLGTGRFKDAETIEVKGEIQQQVRAKRVLIATGSSPASLPGMEWHTDRIATSTEALSYPEVPEHLVVVGAGAIGLEMGSVWRRLGARVTVVEYLTRILPGTDDEMADLALRAFKKQGLKFKLGARVNGARADGAGCILNYNDQETLTADRILVAVGRIPRTKELDLAARNVKTDERGFIEVDEQFRTSAPDVYAVGDVIGGALLAHKASEEAIACVEQIATGVGRINYDTLPAIVYTDPEIAVVGKTETELKRLEIPYKKGAFTFRSNGRARAMGQTEGMVKILSHAQTDRVLGVHIVGPRAGDLIAEAAAGIEFGASAEDISMTWHPHPTLSEAIQEAALDVEGRAIHAWVEN